MIFKKQTILGRLCIVAGITCNTWISKKSNDVLESPQFWFLFFLFCFCNQNHPKTTHLRLQKWPTLQSCIFKSNYIIYILSSFFYWAINKNAHGFCGWCFVCQKKCRSFCFFFKRKKKARLKNKLWMRWFNWFENDNSCYVCVFVLPLNFC